MCHIISLKEQSKEDILEILSIAKTIKAKKEKGEITDYLASKTLIMLFEKTSTRTRLSFEAGMTQLGGHAIFLDFRTNQFSMTSFSDEIRAVMKYGDVLMFRARKARDVLTAASFDEIPVIDACSEKYHPALALSDILTMDEFSGGIENVKKVAWLGIENNVSNTLKLACAKLGIEVALASPEADPNSVDEELNKMAESTGKVYKTADIEAALSEADYVHTDTWMNMEFFENGEVMEKFRGQYEQRKKKFMSYQLNAKIVDKYTTDAKIMHCRP